MLTWKRPQKHHHMKERIFPVLPVQKLSKSVHGAWRNPKFRSFFFIYKKKRTSFGILPLNNSVRAINNIPEGRWFQRNSSETVKRFKVKRILKPHRDNSAKTCHIPYNLLI